METYTSVPKKFVIGDTLEITISDSDHPAPTYSMQLVLVSLSGKSTTASTDSGSSHLLTVDTTTLSAGRYDYQLQAVGTGYRATIDSGSIEFITDFSSESITTLDARDWLDKSIDALQAAIEGRADKVQLSQKIGNNEVQNMSLSEQLDALRNLKRIKAAKGGMKKSWKTIRPRFVN